MIFVRSRTSIGDVQLDATLRVKHQVVAQVSTSPLEDGAEITDHVRILPQNMEMVGIITPTENTLLAQSLRPPPLPASSPQALPPGPIPPKPEPKPWFLGVIHFGVASGSSSKKRLLRL